MKEESLFEKWKSNLGTTRPWDLVDPKTDWATEDVAKGRFDICSACPELIKITKQCKKCGCLMSLKTKLQDATCPIGKW